MQGAAETVSKSSMCVYSSFPARLVEASQGMDGQEMAWAASCKQNDGTSRQEKCRNNVPGSSGDAK